MVANMKDYNSKESSDDHIAEARLQYNSSLDIIDRMDLYKSSSPSLFADIQRVNEILSRLIKPEEVEPWFNKPIPSLDYKAPIDIIRNGDTNRIIELLVQVEEGIHV